jgi:hypothetical protein
MREHRVTLQRNKKEAVALVVEVMGEVAGDVLEGIGPTERRERDRVWPPIDGVVVANKASLHGYLTEIFEGSAASNRAVAFEMEWGRLCRLTGHSPEEQAFSVDLDKLGASDG